MNLKDAMEYAKSESENGYAQHVNKISNNDYQVEDWFDSESTVVSFEDGEQLGSLKTFEGKQVKRKSKKISLLSLYEGNDDAFSKEFEYTKEERNAFMESVKNFEVYGHNIYRSKELADTVKEISQLVELANGFTLKETDGWFDNVTISRHSKQMSEAVKVLQKEANEIMSRQQRLEAAYEDIGSLLGRYYDV